MTGQKPLDLGPIQARLAAATPGPWHDDEDHIKFRTCARQGDFGWVPNGPVAFEQDTEQGLADAEFVGHSHADVTALLAEVERLRAVADITDAATAYVEEPDGSDNVPLYWGQLRDAVEHYRAVEARLAGGPS